ncbi:MAG: LLM class flavin-dependent oxidoreductase [Chloroflexi bacterium]|nr:LLM class flavin-dependent oxidoreductase [Chloroflexota bacterium]
MQYGLNFPNGGLYHGARSLGEFARLAEAAGWDGVFLEDYIVWQGHPDVPTYDPWVALAAADAGRWAATSMTHDNEYIFSNKKIFFVRRDIGAQY